MYVASAIGGQAFVVYGAMPGTGCGLGGNLYAVNLASKTSTVDTCCANGVSVASSADGSEIAIGGNDLNLYVYNVAQQSLFSTGAAYQNGTATISGDGNVVAQQTVFTDSAANIVGQVANSFGFFPTVPTPITASSPDGFTLTALLDPQFNASGSLYFFPHPNLVDIVDVHHGTLGMRFSLTETISNVAVPLAVDSGGAIRLPPDQQGIDDCQSRGAAAVNRLCHSSECLAGDFGYCEGQWLQCLDYGNCGRSSGYG